MFKSNTRLFWIGLKIMCVAWHDVIKNLSKTPFGVRWLVALQTSSPYAILPVMAYLGYESYLLLDTGTFVVILMLMLLTEALLLESCIKNVGR